MSEKTIYIALSESEANTLLRVAETHPDTGKWGSTPGRRNDVLSAIRDGLSAGVRDEDDGSEEQKLDADNVVTANEIRNSMHVEEPESLDDKAAGATETADVIFGDNSDDPVEGSETPQYGHETGEIVHEGDLDTDGDGDGIPDSRDMDTPDEDDLRHADEPEADVETSEKTEDELLEEMLAEENSEENKDDSSN